ncbi:hypothetical protein F2P56_033961 [Juglans regia]|uniref:SHSP domain-containing protein n=2 Tax=Juglans regia TaxID=51240 RepID=A0A833WTW2_JUGRE|nr:uncharacterized protein LOC118343681 [Juglans regia]KAF5444864.1 hypothetical protein F2P56_033961 [Juglans regia]
MANNDGCSDLNSGYIDFEPYCKWRRGEKIKQENSKDGKIKRELGDILEIHLQGFKREQLKAYIDGNTLKLTGEMEPDEYTLIRRFSKEIDISKDYQTDNIKLSFNLGVLSLTMLKKVPLWRQALKQLGPEGFLCTMEMEMQEKLVKITAAVFLGMTVGYLSC